MKRLYLVRHAKSSWKDFTLADIERPLNKRGRNDAPVMGRRLLREGWLPDLVVSSPAMRAYETAYIVMSELKLDPSQIVTDDALYLAEPADLLGFVAAAPHAARSLMLFGHNPGMTDFANRLCNVHIDNIPTCGVICADLKIQRWAQVAYGCARLAHFDFPKNIEAA